MRRAALLAIACILLSAQAVLAEFKPDLDDDYLKREFDWGLYLDARPAPNYLSYKGSRLHPLERVRVYMRDFHRGEPDTPSAGAKIYEEFWYHDGHVLGVRRKNVLSIKGDHMGNIVIGPAGSDEATVKAAIDAMVRVLMDLQLRRVVVGVTSSPEDSYDLVVSGLKRYSFFSEMDADRGSQLSIHLRSHSGVRDQYLYLH